MSLGLPYTATVLLTMAGMMTSVLIFSVVGRAFSKWISKRRRAQRKPVFCKQSRLIVQIWRRFGVTGIAFLTPVIFTPILGTIVVALFGASRKHILIHMFWSSLFWSATLTFMVTEFGKVAVKLF